MYLDYYKEDKKGNLIGLLKQSDRVLVIDEAMSELFWPTKQRNSETTKFCHELALGVANTLLTALEDALKATFE